MTLYHSANRLQLRRVQFLCEQTGTTLLQDRKSNLLISVQDADP